MDEYSLKTALSKYGDTVLRAAAAVAGNRPDAEDVFQDVFFAFYQRAEPFRCEEHVKAWLIRAAVNKAKNIRSSAWVRKHVRLTENIPAAQSAQQTDVLAEMQKLKAKERAVLYLHYYEGYAFKEIAELLKTREGTVRSLASRARAALKELLTEE